MVLNVVNCNTLIFFLKKASTKPVLHRFEKNIRINNKIKIKT